MKEFIDALVKAPLSEFWGALSDLKSIKLSYILLTFPGLVVYFFLLICTTVLVFMLTIVGFGLSTIYMSRYAKRKNPPQED